jgi:SAGA-associated factor 73
MSDAPVILKCNHCKRPLTETGMPKHIERCLNKKQEKSRKKKEAKEARDAAARKEKGAASDEDDVNGTSGGGASKKRKAADEAEEGGPTKKKKKKDEPKAKAAKQKAPVDVEKQCGVELPQGGQCARSLTCKSHSMGAKRAVPGRSAPYDKLLAEYQRKNQAKLQKAQFDANAPDPEDDELESGPIDEEAETAAVAQAVITNWNFTPGLYARLDVPLQMRYDNIRRRTGMEEAIKASRSNGKNFFGGARTSDSQPTPDAEGIVHSRRASVAPGARSSMPARSNGPFCHGEHRS